jgi:hypothetical protein
MMLGHWFRFRVQNTQNQAITCALTYRPWKFDANGAVVYGAEVAAIASGSVAATTGTAAQTNVNNATDLWMGAELTLAMTAASATNGSGAVVVTLERSTDGGATWPTTGLGAGVGSYTVTAGDGTAARRANFEVGL